MTLFSAHFFDSYKTKDYYVDNFSSSFLEC